MRTAILLVSYNSAKDIEACLLSLANATTCNFDVFIFENGSKYSLQLLQELYVLAAVNDRYIDSRQIECFERRGSLAAAQSSFVYLFSCHENLGFAAANNLLIEIASGKNSYDAFWFLNPDTRPEPQALEALIAKLGLEFCDAVGSCLISPVSGSVQLYAGRWRKYLARGLNLGSGLHRINSEPESLFLSRMSYLSGASLLVRSSVAAGRKFDERFFLYCEDVDWCMRLPPIKLAICKESCVIHDHGSSIGSSESHAHRSPLSIFLDERSKLLFSKKHYGKAFYIIAAITFILCFQYLWRGNVGGFFYAVRGWKAGFLNKQGRPSELRV